MGICILKEDHPLRVQFGPGLVIHAAREYIYGGYTRYIPGGGSERIPEQKRVTVACGGAVSRLYDRKDSRYVSDYLVPNTTPITCRNCLRRLGMDEDYKASNVRYVVFNNKTEEYYRHSRYSCSWVNHMLDATLYKVKPAAEKHTKRLYYVNKDGKDITRDEYLKVIQRERQLGIRPNTVRTVTRKSPIYDVITITINIEVQDNE